jgi:hypothetical protein
LKIVIGSVLSSRPENAGEFGGRTNGRSKRTHERKTTSATRTGLKGANVAGVVKLGRGAANRGSFHFLSNVPNVRSDGEDLRVRREAESFQPDVIKGPWEVSTAGRLRGTFGVAQDRHPQI